MSPDPISQEEIDALLAGEGAKAADPHAVAATGTAYAAPVSSGPVLGSVDLATLRQANPTLDRALGIPLFANCVLAEKTVRMEDIINLYVGSVIQFSKPYAEPMELRVNNVTVAMGDIVTIGDRTFGLQLKNVTSRRTIVGSLSDNA